MQTKSSGMRGSTVLSVHLALHFQISPLSDKAGGDGVCEFLHPVLPIDHRPPIWVLVSAMLEPAKICKKTLQLMVSTMEITTETTNGIIYNALTHFKEISKIRKIRFSLGFLHPK